EPAAARDRAAPAPEGRCRAFAERRWRRAAACVRRDRRSGGSLRILGPGHFARRRNRGVRSALSRPGRRREYFRRDEEPMGLGRLHPARSCALPARGPAHALFYDWWNICVRLADPSLHREAITSRPLFLSAIATRTRHARQT